MQPIIQFHIMEQPKKPIKRKVYLLPLSRDHHHGLLLSWKVGQGLKNGTPAGEIADYVRYFWQASLEKHFREEEVIVFRKMPVTDAGCLRAIKEHNGIRKLIEKITDPKKNSRELLKTLCEEINNHIRFEERELFPAIEVALSTQDLEVMGKALEKAHAHFPDNWENTFWIKKK